MWSRTRSRRRIGAGTCSSADVGSWTTGPSIVANEASRKRRAEALPEPLPPRIVTRRMAVPADGSGTARCRDAVYAAMPPDGDAVFTAFSTRFSVTSWNSSSRRNGAASPNRGHARAGEQPQPERSEGPALASWWTEQSAVQ